MRVPFNDLARQLPVFEPDLSRAIAEVVASGWYVMGPQHDAFEAEFAAYCGVDHCMGVGNGTDALEIALRAVGCGDEVVTAANAGGYTSTAILLAGAVPVFADVDEQSLLLTAHTVEPLLSERTRAIVVTHLYGKLADVDAIVAVAETRGIVVLEDCAQAHGARRAGRAAGSFGDIAAFSFYPTKNLGALGDGGAVVTRDSDLARRVRQLRQYGWAEKYRAVTPGGCNSRLDEIQAAVLRVKLRSLDGQNARRRRIAERYRIASEGTPLRMLPAGDDSVAHLCVGLHPDRDGFRERMTAAGVDTAVHYPVPDHRQEAFSEAGWRAASLATTESAAGRVVSLPCFPELTDDEVDRVCAAIAESA
jgi:aminotransferase EvaB